MLTVQTWQQIRTLAAQGRSQRAIAAELSLSRNTVAAALAREGPPRYQRQAPREHALEAHRERVEAGLRRGLGGVRLLQEVRAAGYAGSEATFYRWFSALKKQQKETKAACRFETDPGEQAQFDWSPYTLSLGGVATRVIVYSLLLGYSRRVHFCPALNEKQESVFEALEAGWQHFSGACRTLVVDNAKVFVTRHQGSEVEWNANFLRLCGHYAVQPIAATPAHPQGKGKVENPFGHLERRFLAGGEWRDFDHFQRELLAFEAEWEQRLHGTTKEAPLLRFERERTLLLPLPKSPFLHLVESFRQVSRDCLVSYGGVRYSVPWPYAGKSVLVRESQGRRLLVFSPAGEEIARHRLLPSGAPPVILPEHYEGLKKRHLAALPTLAARFRERYGPSGRAEAFLQRLLAQHRHHPDRPLAKVLSLLEGVPASVALAVLAEAVEFNLCTPRFLEELLRRASRGGAAGGLTAPVTTRPACSQPALPDLDVERPLAHYGRALSPAAAAFAPAPERSR